MSGVLRERNLRFEGMLCRIARTTHPSVQLAWALDWKVPNSMPLGIWVLCPIERSPCRH